MSRNRFIWGIVLIAIGVLIILARADVFDYPFRLFWRNFWPIALIVAGTAMIFYSIRKTEPKLVTANGPSAESYTISNQVNKVFGDIHFDAANVDLDGMRLETVFGDISLATSGANVKPGDNRISLTTTIGDITVIVPRMMEVFGYGTSTIGDQFILGRSQSGFSVTLTAKTDGFEQAARKVYITARTVIGDVKIYRA
ncbi:MAG: hypothetical protein JW763_03685 [candidate division Zixibacteria bacterium]|nr:hypothetical protein [candidate division Zixibacteria bacterium]